MTSSHESAEQSSESDGAPGVTQEEQVVVVGPDGQPVGTIPASALPGMVASAEGVRLIERG